MSDASLGTATLRTKLDTAGLKVGLSQAEAATTSAVQRIDHQIAGIGKSFQNIGARMTVGITAPLTALGAVGVRSAMQLETFSKSLNVLIGDTQRANAAFEELYEFSANTTFEWRSLTEGTRTLAAFGVEAEDLVPTLSMLGDVAAGLDTPLEDLAQIFGRVRITGRAGMEEINRLADRGVPIYTELAKQMGVGEDAVRDLVSAGAVGFPQLEGVFKSLTSEGGMFFGMMQAQTDTTAGRLAKLKDSFEQVTDVIGERLLPGFDRLIGVGQRATDWFVNLDESTQGLFVGLGTTLSVSGPLLVGFGTLAVQLPKITAAFTAMRVAMGPLFGPVGLIVTGAGVIAGLAMALSGRQDSLDAAISKANDALAAGDSDSLTGALDEVIEKADGPLKTVFQQFRDDLVETGNVGVEQSQRIANAFSNLPELMKAQADVAKATAALEALKLSMSTEVLSGFGSSDPANVEAFLRDQLAKIGRADVLEYLRYDESTNRLRFDPLPGGGHVTLSGAATDLVATANRMLEAPISGLASAEAELAQANDKLADVLAQINNLPARGTTPGAPPTGGIPAQVAQEIAEALGAARPYSPATIRAMNAAEVTGPTTSMATFATPEELQKALIEARTRLGPVATQWADYLAKELDREVLRFQTGLPDGIRRGPQPITAPQPFAEVDMTGLRSPAMVRAELATARAAQAAAGTSESLIAATNRVTELEAELRRLTSGVQLSVTALAKIPDAVEIITPAFRAGIGTPREITAPGVYADVNMAGLRSIAAVQADIVRAEEMWRTAGDDAGRAAAQALVNTLRRELEAMTLAPSLRTIFGDPTPEYEGNFEKSIISAGEQFNTAMITAGLTFTDTLAKGIKSGDIGSIVSGGFGAASSIIGAIPGISTGLTILAGLLPTFGGLLGGLFGGNRSNLEATRAAGAATRGAPAIDLSIIINQSLNVQSLTDPASRRAVDGLLDDMVRRVEDTLKRNVLPRLNALDGGAT